MNPRLDRLAAAKPVCVGCGLRALPRGAVAPRTMRAPHRGRAVRAGGLRGAALSRDL